MTDRSHRVVRSAPVGIGALARAELLGDEHLFYRLEVCAPAELDGPVRTGEASLLRDLGRAEVYLTEPPGPVWHYVAL